MAKKDLKYGDDKELKAVIKSRFVYHEKEIWFQERSTKVWINLYNQYEQSASVRVPGIGGRMSQAIMNAGYRIPERDTKDGPVQLSSSQLYRMFIEYVANNCKSQELESNILAVFKNAIVRTKWDGNNKKLETEYTDKIPFTTAQIPLKIPTMEHFKGKLKKTKEYRDVLEYFGWISSGNSANRRALFSLGGAMLCKQNFGVMGIIHSEDGQTGKSQYVSLYSKIGGSKVGGIELDALLKKSAFKFETVMGKNGGYIDELPKSISENATDMFKTLADPSSKHLTGQAKYKGAVDFTNNITLVITTNRYTTWYGVDEPFKSRVAVINFNTVDRVNYFDASRFDTEILNNEKALEIIAFLSLTALGDAVKTKDSRAKGFIGDLDQTWYWSKAQDSTNDILKEFYEQHLELRLKLHKDIMVSEINYAIRDFNLNQGYKYKPITFRRDMIEYINKMGIYHVAEIKSSGARWRITAPKQGENDDITGT